MMPYVIKYTSDLDSRGYIDTGLTPVIKWFKENNITEWSSGPYQGMGQWLISFRYEEDAMAFKLRWV